MKRILKVLVLTLVFFNSFLLSSCENNTKENINKEHNLIYDEKMQIFERALYNYRTTKFCLTKHNNIFLSKKYKDNLLTDINVEDQYVHYFEDGERQDVYIKTGNYHEYYISSYVDGINKMYSHDGNYQNKKETDNFDYSELKKFVNFDIGFDKNTFEYNKEKDKFVGNLELLSECLLDYLSNDKELVDAEMLKFEITIKDNNFYLFEVKYQCSRKYIIDDSQEVTDELNTVTMYILFEYIYII